MPHAMAMQQGGAMAPARVRVRHARHGEGVRAVLASGDIHTGDVLIGCDGIHSRVRQTLFGSDAPRFTGCIAWRATIPVERLPEGYVRPVASNWIGRGGHFVHYYLRRGTLVNCVGVLEGQDWTAESWSAEGEKRDFLADFADWHDDLKVLIRASERCFRWGLFDRDPMPRWGRGRRRCPSTPPSGAGWNTMTASPSSSPPPPAPACRRWPAADATTR